MQAIYLGLQNSGAFESQDELDRAFDSFVSDRRGSTNRIWEDAQNYDWAKTSHETRDKLQIQNTLQKTMDWKAIRTISNIKDFTAPEKTTAETNAERMRSLEERKNQMMLKLIDIVEPIVDGLSKALDSEKLKKIATGLVKFLTEVVPKLTEILAEIAKRVGDAMDSTRGIFGKLDALAGVDDESWFSAKSAAARRDAVKRFFTGDDEATPQHANGGIVWGTSIVGERGPEAIIPLDYSRAQRAENIAYSIQNNFNMSGNQTTALSLAEAVSSRDFARAMGRAAFKANRLGAF